MSVEGSDSCTAEANDSQASLPSPRRLQPRRLVRSFAVFAALVMVTVAFGVVVQPALADRTVPAELGTTAVQGTTVYGPGTAVRGLSGATQVTNYANFRRWDGVWQPMGALNFSAGNWPYRVNETASSFTASVGDLAFTQGKIPGATYAYRPDGIEETIRLGAPFPTPVMAPSIFVPFSTTYLTLVNGASVSLYDYAGSLAWTTAPFQVWDSSLLPHRWSSGVSSIEQVPGGLSLALDPAIVSEVAYPLYIDPTWTFGGAVGWGTSTFVNATTDLGDGSVKVGYFADNFNNNASTGWTTDSGTVTFSNGEMNLGNATTVHAGSSWGDQQVSFSYSFASWVARGSALQLIFRSKDANDYYSLSISVTSVSFAGEASGTVALAKVVSGKSTTLGSFSYTPLNFGGTTLAAEGNGFTINFSGGWFQRNPPADIEGPLQVVAFTDPNPPSSEFTGPVKFSTDRNGASSVDDVRVWNTNAGSLVLPVRNGGSNRPLSVEVSGSVAVYDQIQILIRSSANNQTWGPWTLVKADAASGIPYAVPDQNQQQYYQPQLVLTTGDNSTPVLTQVTTAEGVPASSPSANTGVESWYPYVAGMVNVVTGNLYHTTRDLSFQGKGVTLAIARSYNSLLSSTGGPFGTGWAFTYGQNLTISSNGNVTWNGPDGSRFLFVAKGISGGFSPPAGVSDRLVWNSNGTYTLWMTDGSSERFSSAGLLQTITDKNRNALTLTYTGTTTLLLSSVTDGVGKSLTFGYDSSNRIISVTDSLRRKVTYQYYTSFNGLEYVTDPLGNTSFYGYNAGNVLSQIRDPVGKQIQVNYVTGGKVSSLYLQNVTSSGAIVWQFRDDTIMYNTTTTRAIQNARGYWTTVTLNSLGNPVQVSGPSLGCAACDSSGNTSSYLWDGEMNRIQTTDGRGDMWAMSYGFRSNLLSTTDPGGNVSSETWLEVNNATNYFVAPLSSTTYRGFTTTFAYDGKGNRVSMTDPGGNVTRYGYDASGFLNKTASARGFTTWNVYNGSGYLAKREDNLSETTTYAYDVLGRQTSVTDPLGFVTTTTYDTDSRVTKVKDPMGNFTTYQYNGRGDRTQVTDPDGAATAYTYNVTNGNVRTTTDSGGNVTRYAYDLRGNLNATTDSDLHTTYYQYDPFDRVTKVTTPLSYVTKDVYDAAGNRIARTDGNGATTKYAYDKLDRLIATMYPGAPVYASPQTLTYSYDKDGNRITATGFGYTETFGYDRSDRLSSSTFNYGTYSVTTKYSHNQDGNKATMSLGTATTNYFYDRVDRLTGLLDPEGQNTTYGYDKDSRQTSERDPSGVITTSLYDKASRLMAIYTNTSGGAALESFTYGYDKAGLRTSESDVQGGTTTATLYAYDMVHRLYKTTQGSSTTVDTYDAVGNLKTETAASTETFSYDADNELTNASSGPTNYVTYAYDRNGNRVTATASGGARTTYGYDYENRLLSSNPGCTYTYAPSGERVTSACPASTTDLAYDPSTPGGSNLLATYTSSGTQTARYLDTNGMNTPVEVYQGGNHYAYQTDALGSVRMLTGGSQNATVAYAYDSWGNTVSQTGSLSNPLQYAGSIHDSSNGLDDMRARFYDPSANGGHRFLSSDPGACPSLPWSGYAYVGDNPTGRVDPTGKFWGSWNLWIPWLCSPPTWFNWLGTWGWLWFNWDTFAYRLALASYLNLAQIATCVAGLITYCGWLAQALFDEIATGQWYLVGADLVALTTCAIWTCSWSLAVYFLAAAGGSFECHHW